MIDTTSIEAIQSDYITLYPHQLAIIQSMYDIEAYNYEGIPKPIYYKSGLIHTDPGMGITCTIVDFMNRKRSVVGPLAINVQETQIFEHEGECVMPSIQTNTLLATTVLVVNTHNITQWQKRIAVYGMSCLVIGDRNTIKTLKYKDIETDVIIVRAAYHNDIQRIFAKYNVIVSRVVYDHFLFLMMSKNSQSIQSKFTWFITNVAFPPTTEAVLFKLNAHSWKESNTILCSYESIDMKLPVIIQTPEILRHSSLTVDEICNSYYMDTVSMESYFCITDPQSIELFKKKTAISSDSMSLVSIMKDNNMETECPICFVECDKNIYMTCCGKIVCLDCTSTWMNENHMTCPYCRGSIIDSIRDYQKLLPYELQILYRQNTPLHTIEDLLLNPLNKVLVVYSTNKYTIDNGIPYSEMPYNNTNIESVLKNFTETRVLLMSLNKKYHGLNLQSVTHLMYDFNIHPDDYDYIIGILQRMRRETPLTTICTYLCNK